LTLTKLPIQGVGSLADWASAILSFVAILVVFWQVNRESKNERAFYIENKMLHFSAERTTIINSDEKILYHESYEDLKNLYDELHGNKTKYIIRLTNTSENTVYSLKIILKYAGEKVERTNRYAFDSLYSKQAILLVTDERIPEGGFVDLQIKFRTAANELGYYHFHVDVAGNFTEYTFVKDKEPVSVYGDDVLIDKSSDKAKKLKEKFKEIVTRRYSRRIVTIPEEEFNDLKRYIQERKKRRFLLK
jgi:hypothetical protein